MDLSDVKSMTIGGKDVKKLSYANIPIEYQEVEYIESSGTQYINTGVLGKGSIGYDMEVKIKAYGIEYGVLATSTNSTRPHYVLQAHSGALRLYLTKSGSTGATTNVVTYQSDTTDFHIVTYNVENDFKAYYDGTYRATSSVQDTPDIPYPFTIFARNIGGVVQKYSYSIIKYLKMYDAGVLIRNFIPCYRKSDNEIGMYDTIGKTFYTNQGSGTFTKGNDIEDKIWWEKPVGEYTFVSYIESSGTQYIDTGITSITKEFAIEINFSITTSQAYQTLWCCRTHNVDVTRTCFTTALTGFRNDQGTQTSVSKSLSLNQKYNLKSTKTQFILDNNILLDNIATTNNAINDKVWLLSSYAVGTSNPSNQFYGKLYSCEIYDNGTLIRDFKPCVRNSDGVIGLLDEVNDVFYTNAGTGTFKIPE